MHSNLFKKLKICNYSYYKKLNIIKINVYIHTKFVRIRVCTLKLIMLRA